MAQAALFGKAREGHDLVASRVPVSNAIREQASHPLEQVKLGAVFQYVHDPLLFPFEHIFEPLDHDYELAGRQVLMKRHYEVTDDADELFVVGGRAVRLAKGEA